MLKGRRAGTLTAGLSLISFGVLFILRNFLPKLDYTLILSLWPLILILLGAEILAAYFLNREEKIRYDGWSVFLMVLLSFFAAGMAIAEFIVQHYEELHIQVY